MSKSLLLLSFSAAALAACGGTSVYRPASAANLQFEDAREIDDDQIRAAFAARPQLQSPMRVAYYAFEDERSAQIEAMLRQLPGVNGTYRIPSLLATGLRRGYGERDVVSPGGAPGASATPSLSMRQLRLSAARAHCDVLLVFDYGYRIEHSTNGLVALNVLVLPVFLVGFLDADVQSHLDAYVIDTRNGYLHAQIESHEEDEVRRLTAFSDRAEARVDLQWTALLARTRRQLARTLTVETHAAASAPTPTP